MHLELCVVHLDRQLTLTQLCQGDQALGPQPEGFPLRLARAGAVGFA